MRNYLFSIIVSFMVVCPVSGQTTRDDMSADPGRYGGTYYVYHNPTKAQTPAPRGYKPFYISHYGRHGSRYLYSDKDYRGLGDILRKAQKAGCLTRHGESLLSRIDTLTSIALGHGEALSPLGVRQHHEIAYRMYKSFPEVFKAGGHISARSTTVMRCAMSMAAFCEALKEMQPKLDVYREADQKYMSYMNFHTKQQEEFDGNGPWKDAYNRFEIAHIHPQRFVNSLFSDAKYIAANINPTDLMWKMYWVCVDAQDIDTPVRIYDAFTPDELFELWQCFNYGMYVRNADCGLNQGLAMESVRPLISNIIESADSAIQTGGDVATLRFGHDGNIIPLAAGLHLRGCDACVSNPNDFYKAWNDWKVAPMAANIQIVFFKNKGNDVIVKFLLNEEETTIPIEAVTGPYYRWEDVKKFLTVK